MIRFSYSSPEETDLPFRHYSLEGDNERGYVLLGWNDPAAGGEGFDEPSEMMLQQWFETLGEAMDHCINEFCIMRSDWSAPTSSPPVSGKYRHTDRGRRKGESTVLNPNAAKQDTPKT